MPRQQYLKKCIYFMFINNSFFFFFLNKKKKTLNTIYSPSPLHLQFSALLSRFSFFTNLRTRAGTPSPPQSHPISHPFLSFDIPSRFPVKASSPTLLLSFSTLWVRYKFKFRLHLIRTHFNFKFFFSCSSMVYTKMPELYFCMPLALQVQFISGRLLSEIRSVLF